MAQFFIKIDAMRTLIDEEARLRKELNGMAWSIQDISRKLNFKSGASENFRRRLNRLSVDAEKQEGQMGRLENILDSVVAVYAGTEENICRDAETEARRIREQSATASALPNISAMIASAVGAYAASVSSVVSQLDWSKVLTVLEQVIGKAKATDGQPEASWWNRMTGKVRDQIIGKAEEIVEKAKETAETAKEIAEKAPRYNVPDYTKKGVEPKSDGTYDNYVYWRKGGYGSASYRNKDGNVSCTYYTLRKLKEQGLSYPCTGGPGNGGQWYSNFDKDSGLPHYGGENALYDMVNNMTLPQANVVVSIDGEYGHVMLLDRLYRDENGGVRVEYSEMYNPKFSDITGNNPVQDKSLDEYMVSCTNQSWCGKINGVVVIGAGEHERDKTSNLQS